MGSRWSQRMAASRPKMVVTQPTRSSDLQRKHVMHCDISRRRRCWKERCSGKSVLGVDFYRVIWLDQEIYYLVEQRRFDQMKAGASIN